MPRATTQKTAPAEAPALLPEVQERMTTGQELATAAQQVVAALARQLNYQGSTDPAVLENSARDAIRRIGAGIFELGGYLLLLKEACGHGQFLPALERLNIGVEASRRYMQIAKRFANSSTSRNLEALGMSKLVELLPLDDEQIEDLTGLGQTGELALDDVARMSVKELRAAVREVRAERDADRQLLDKKNARIDKLEREKRLIARLPANETLAVLQKEATAIMNDALGCIRGNLRQALAALSVENGQTSAEGVFMAGLVGQLAAELARLREEFDLPDVSNAADVQLAAEVAEWSGQ